MPNTIASVVSARLDTLPANRKGILADAAVIGAVFWSASVAMVGGRDQAPVEDGLHDLSRQEFVRPIRASSIAGESEFRFWHAIVRDVAYAQLPRRIRADRHRRAANGSSRWPPNGWRITPSCLPITTRAHWSSRRRSARLNWRRTSRALPFGTPSSPVIGRWGWTSEGLKPTTVARWSWRNRTETRRPSRLEPSCFSDWAGRS